MGNKNALKYVLGIALLIVGYFAGVFLHPKFAKAEQKELPTGINIEQLLSQPLVDMVSEEPVSPDTLFAHDRNLLVFWTPTCKFCRQFFQSRPNAYEVGIFCFPMTDDLDYVKYFVEQKEIEYPNFVSTDSTGIVSVSMPTLRAVPTFVVLDGEGNIVEQKIGVDGIDTLLDKLYNY